MEITTDESYMLVQDILTMVEEGEDWSTIVTALRNVVRSYEMSSGDYTQSDVK